MTDPVQPRPQPVVQAAVIGGYVQAAITAIGGAVIVFLPVVSGEQVSQFAVEVGLAVTALISLTVFVGAWIHGKAGAAKVTPLSNPVDHQGRPLVVDPALYGKHAAPVTYVRLDDRSPSMGPDLPEETPAVTDEPVRRIPEQIVPGKRLGAFPDVEWEAWKEHPRSAGRTSRMVAAIELYRSGGELPAPDVPEQGPTDHVAD